MARGPSVEVAVEPTPHCRCCGCRRIVLRDEGPLARGVAEIEITIHGGEADARRSHRR